MSERQESNPVPVRWSATRRPRLSYSSVVTCRETDELLGLKPVRIDRAKENPEIRRLWRKFQQIVSLPEKDRRAVIRLVNSLVSAKAAARG